MLTLEKLVDRVFIVNTFDMTTWVCSACTFSNKNQHLSCSICSKEKPNVKEKPKICIIDLSKAIDVESSFSSSSTSSSTSKIHILPPPHQSDVVWKISKPDTTPATTITKTKSSSIKTATTSTFTSTTTITPNLFNDTQFPPCPASIDGRASTSKSTTSSSSSQTETEEPIPNCKCQNQCKSREVKKAGANRGRFFYSCAKTQQYSCGFFKWCKHGIKPHTKQARELRWERVGQSYRTLRRNNTFRPTDVLQGRVGDCWFLSAIAVVAERPDLIAKIFQPTLDQNKNENDWRQTGKITVRLFVAGRWITVDIDDYLPMMDKEISKNKGSKGAGTTSSTSSSSSSTTFLDPLRKAAKNTSKTTCAFAKEGKHGEMWVPFLEKAFAKCNGSYQQISGGEVAEGLECLTSFPTESISFNSATFNSELTWIRMMSFVESGFPMGAGTAVSGNGIVGGHAYSILDCRELEGLVVGIQKKMTSFFQSKDNNSSSKQKQKKRRKEDQDVAPEHRNSLRLLRVRNPWGKKEFTGQFSSNSEQWTRRLRAKLDNTKKNDGDFWISWSDFIMHFNVVDVVKAHKNWHTTEYDLGLPTSSNNNGGSIKSISSSSGDYKGSSSSSSSSSSDDNKGSSSSNSSSSSDDSRVIVLSLRIHKTTWCYVSLFTKDVRKQTDSRQYNSLSSGTSKLLPMSFFVVKYVENQGYVPLYVHLVGQQASTHQELMLDDQNCTYHIFLLAPPSTFGNLPINIRLFSSLPISSVVERWDTSQRNEKTTKKNVPLPSLFLRGLSSLKTYVRTVLSDAIEMKTFSSESGCTILTIRNTNPYTVMVTLTFQREQRAKTSCVFPTTACSIATPSPVLAAIGMKKESDDDDSDVQIISDPDKEEDDVSHVSQKKKKTIPTAKRKRDPPTIKTVCIPVHGLSERVIAMGIRVSKYTDAKPIHVLDVRTEKLLRSEEEKEEINWLFRHVNLF